MFEQAARLKLRFKLSNGTVSAEDLWDLQLTALDQIARNLHKSLKDEEEVSFITEKPRTNSRTELQFNIVKRVIEVKLAEREEKKQREAAAAKKETIKRILSAKQDETLQNMSIEELTKELESLG